MTEQKKNIQVRGKDELQSEEGTREGRYYKPAVDIYETDDALHVQADVPGADADEFEIDLRDNTLTLTGPTENVEARWDPVYEEYGIGHFTRQFRLGKRIDQEKITAELNNGVLELTLPKVEKAQPKKIEIETK
jgi:HSP20 family protein